MIREEIEIKGLEVLLKHKRVLLELPTGFGKTKIGLSLCSGKTLILVPQVNLIKTWQDEIIKWGYELEYYDIICYQSLDKIEGEYNSIILDESHSITQARLDKILTIIENKYLYVICLSGSVNDEKRDLLKSIGINKSNTIKVNTEDAVDEGIIAEFNITVIQCVLDDVISYDYDFGTKKVSKINKTTDKSLYIWLTKQYEYWKIRMFNCDKKDLPFIQSRYNYFMQKRTAFIYNNSTKTEYADKIISKLILENQRHIVFGGSIEQIENMRFSCDSTTYHSKLTKKQREKTLDDFNNKVFNDLYSVRAINMGVNLVDVDSAVIIQIDSQEHNIIQRLGRILRLGGKQIKELYVMIIRDTQDEKWCDKALSNYNKERIKYIDYRNL